MHNQDSIRTMGLVINERVLPIVLALVLVDEVGDAFADRGDARGEDRVDEKLEEIGPEVFTAGFLLTDEVHYYKLRPLIQDIKRRLERLLRLVYLLLDLQFVDANLLDALVDEEARLLVLGDSVDLGQAEEDLTDGVANLAVLVVEEVLEILEEHRSC